MFYRAPRPQTAEHRGPRPSSTAARSVEPSGDGLAEETGVGAAHLQLIGIVEINLDGRNHPGVEQRGQDLLSNGVCDEMEM